MCNRIYPSIISSVLNFIRIRFPTWTMSSTTTLSDEQRARIAQNREKALALRLQKQQNPPTIATANPSTITPVQRSTSNIVSNFSAITSSPPRAQRLTASASDGSRVDSISNFSTSPKNSQPIPSNWSKSGSSSTGLKSKYWSKTGDKTDKNDKFSPTKSSPKLVAKCVLTANHRFQMICSYHKEAIDLFRTIQGASYNPTTRIWSFPLSSYRDLQQKMRQLTTILFEPLPNHITTIFAKYISGASSSPTQSDFDLRYVDDSLLSRLFPFQLEAINFAISNGGRVLIADDMGLGKTIEALGVISYYRDDWPAIIVCPASLRYTWKQAILDWLPSVKEEQIAVIDKNIDFGLIKKPSMRITITGYNLDFLKDEKNLAEMERIFKVVVLDESHYIKNPETNRTKACQKITKKARRVILLSGTPALSRPKELYTQINVINPTIFRSINQFGERYCDPKKIRVKGNHMVLDYSGASNMEELEALLRETIMIRRTKEDVLSQLPAKIRGIVLLDSRMITMEKQAKLRANRIQNDQLNGSERRGALLEFFAATAPAKLKAVTEYVMELLENGKKFLIFAHHQVMLDHLHSTIAQTTHDAIRIDGSTPAAERKNLCDRFQTEEKVRVALLSITASGTGLTLTAANLVVFAELFWNPGILAQAEDRAHRVGQSDCVQVQYLVARGTADDFIWPLVQKKLDILNKGGLSKGAFKTTETLMEPADAKTPQTSIMDFMESFSEKELSDILNDEAGPSSPKKKRLNGPANDSTS